MIYADRLAGKTLVVTGAAQGIGRAVALRAAAEGGNVLFVDRADFVRDVASEAGNRGRSFVCDLETYEGAASALAEAARCFGGFAATSTVPRSSHATKQASLNSAQATDVGRQVGRTLRQTGLCLFARGGHLSLPAGKRLPYRYTNEEDGKTLRRYWTTACQSCSLKSQCTPGRERRVTRWEHEHLLEAVQCSLDANPEAMRQRRETVEHPFGTMKARMGATHFLTKTLPKVAAEMALSVLAYNLTRAMNIVGVKPLIAAIVA